VKVSLSWADDRRTDGRPSPFTTILANISAIITIVTPVASLVTIFLYQSSNVPATVLAVYVCLLTTYLIFLLLTRERRSRREVHYATAMIAVRKAFRSLADASWTIVEGDRSEVSFSLHLRDALQFLAESFSLVTDNSCRTSIKVITSSGHGDSIPDAQVYTLCRSNDSERNDRQRFDRISENSDFRDILKDNAAYFFSNNLPKQLSSGYQNSHWDSRIISEEKFEYRSTIVWPIARARDTTAQPHEPWEEVIGFLCVDTLAIDAFNETYDVPIGAAFAQTLYLALRRFRESQLLDHHEHATKELT
jgi:hypothetical protein